MNFKPYLFDSKDAWEKTIKDSNYNYNMPFNEFMKLYSYYRKGEVPPKKETTPKQTTYEQSEILSQDDIDKLLSEFLSK